MALIALLATVAASTPAAAHNTLIGSTPANGASLPALPAAVTLTFDQAVRLEFAQLTLILPTGGQQPLRGLTADGPSIGAPLPSLPSPTPGRYALGYRIVSNDGHPVTGQITFTLTGAAQIGTPGALPTGGPAETDLSQSSGGWVWGLLTASLAMLALSTYVLARNSKPRDPEPGDTQARDPDPRDPERRGSGAER